MPLLIEQNESIMSGYKQADEHHAPILENENEFRNMVSLFLVRHCFWRIRAEKHCLGCIRKEGHKTPPYSILCGIMGTFIPLEYAKRVVV